MGTAGLFAKDLAGAAGEPVLLLGGAPTLGGDWPPAPTLRLVSGPPLRNLARDHPSSWHGLLPKVRTEQETVRAQ